MNHKGKRLFITGIPTSGKSYLANAVAQKVGAIVVSFDDVREELAKDEKYKKWTNFYLEQDEEEYLKIQVRQIYGIIWFCNRRVCGRHSWKKFQSTGMRQSLLFSNV